MKGLGHCQIDADRSYRAPTDEEGGLPDIMTTLPRCNCILQNEKVVVNGGVNELA